MMASNKPDAVITSPIKRSAVNALNLKSLVEDLESKAEFQTLIKETALNFSKEPQRDDSFSLSLWRLNLEAFFRRSGVYLSAYKGKIHNIDAAFVEYTQAFKKKTVSRRFLVPLELVYFDDSSMDFGSFRIVQLAYDELESLLQNEINRVFYPYAH